MFNAEYFRKLLPIQVARCRAARVEIGLSRGETVTVSRIDVVAEGHVAVEVVDTESQHQDGLAAITIAFEAIAFVRVTPVSVTASDCVLGVRV